MKKRIIAAFVCMVIVALSVLTAFSGCSGEKRVTEVEDRDAFFSEIAGTYGRADSYLGDFRIFIQEDGTGILEYYYDTMNPNSGKTYNKITYRLSTSYQEIYKDNEYSYHTSISTITPLGTIDNSKSSTTIKAIDSKSAWYDEFSSSFEYLTTEGLVCSNDNFIIYTPGTPTSRIDSIDEADTVAYYEFNDINGDYYEDYSYDKDHDGKLDDYLIYDTDINRGFTRIKK